jgi:3-hydroxyacyl-[acyl-carrier-protein] dehydratase
MVINIDQIRKILPQKPPFLMIDRVLDVEPGKKIIALKNVSMDEILNAHFPGKSIMPGALIIEIMAQAAILLYSSINNFQIKESVNYYLGSVKASFLKPVVPGDQLIIEATMGKLLSKGFYVEVKAFVKEEKVAESELICMVGI